MTYPGHVDVPCKSDASILVRSIVIGIRLLPDTCNSHISDGILFSHITLFSAKYGDSHLIKNALFT